MEECKFRLPCGRCEKRGAPCDAPKECEHEWIVKSFEMTKDDLLFHYVCDKCKSTKVEPMSVLLKAITIT